MNQVIIIAILVFVCFIYLYFKPLIQLGKDRKTQESLMNPNDLQTEDIMISSKYYRSILYNFGSEYDYL